MLKKLFRFSCFSLLIIFSACAPKPGIITPPQTYSDRHLSLQEIISKAGDDIDVLKAITDIKVEKNGKPFDSASASALIKRPGQVHLRVYKFGMLVRDFIVDDKGLHVLSGKQNGNIRALSREFYNAVFWWDNMEDAQMTRSRREYIINTPDRNIAIDKATLLPLHQTIRTYNDKIEITYTEPISTEEGLWYPSVITIHMKNFKFSVKLKKIIKNPSLGESDFKTD